MTDFNEKVFDVYLEIDNERKEKEEEVIVDYSLISSKFPKIMTLKRGEEKNRFCLFGYKDKVLELDMHRNEWSLKSLKMVNNSEKL